jgi:hypothetical protein
MFLANALPISNHKQSPKITHNYRSLVSSSALLEPLLKSQGVTDED